MNQFKLGLVVACVFLPVAVGCKTSSDTEHPLREGGTSDSAAADGGLDGEPGDDDFRPPILQPAPRNPPAAGARGVVDAGVDASNTGGAGAQANGGSGGADSGAGGANAGGAAAASGGTGGGSGPDPEDDAGVVEPPACDEVECLCETLCDRGIALACLDEAPREDCLAQCTTVAVGCESEQLETVACRANASAASYVCDEDLWQFVVLGCEALEVALGACLTR